jgi:hypothetical protein
MNVKVGEEDDDLDGIEIEVVDDTPEEDQNRPRRPEDAEPAIPDDDEIAGYSETVQKRIKRLRYEFHEERRGKEAATRERDEAIELARRTSEELKQARQNVTQGETVAIDQAKKRVQAQLEQAERAYKEAYESGDSDALVKAQGALTDIKNEQYRLATFKPQQRPVATPQTPAATPQAPTVPKPSVRAEGWAEKNDWFGKPGSEDLTAQAFVAHERAIKSGIAPDTDEYYKFIDGAVRKTFPDRFQDVDKGQQQRQRPSVVVAPAARSASQNPRKVTLTATQVSIAKRLGVSLQQYAAQMLKDQSNG